uniref:Serine/threonine protein kinase n=1 Tax=Streptomyces sp. NBC_00049 TaxID=2903617 RepID=A0AAU2JLN5_9ACTN
MERIGPSGPTHVGPFQLFGVLGQGGMGRVLLGAGPDGRLVALKQVLARFADDDGFRTRFRREVAASRKLPGAYTAAVMDSDADAPTPWLASVFVAGPSLGAVVKADGVLSEDVVHRLAAGLASALAEIHRAGLIHRDLKPDNVLLAEDGVRVIDLGIARTAESEDETGLTRTGWVIGSPSFMSPEQAESKALTPASDVFSLGSMLVLAATGNSPFAGASTLRTLYDVVHSEPDLSAVPAGLRGVVERCLAKDPADRPTPAQLLELLGPVAPAGRLWPPTVYRMLAAQRADIDRLLAGEPTVPAPAPDPEPVPDPQQDPATEDARPPVPQVAPVPPFVPDRPAPARRRRIVALAAACVLLVAGTGVVAYVRDRVTAPIAYAAVPTCQDAAARLPLERRASGQDTRTEGARGIETGCTWQGLGVAESPAAVVRWDLRRGGDAARNAGTQRERFRVGAAAGRKESGLGFGTEAYWGDPGMYWTCVLAVREGNLTVWVGLQSSPLTTSACEVKAGQVARAALKTATR